MPQLFVVRQKERLPSSLEREAPRIIYFTPEWGYNDVKAELLLLRWRIKSRYLFMDFVEIFKRVRLPQNASPEPPKWYVFFLAIVGILGVLIVFIQWGATVIGCPRWLLFGLGMLLVFPLLWRCMWRWHRIVRVLALLILIGVFFRIAVWRIEVEIQPVLVFVQPFGLMTDNQSWWFEPLIKGKQRPIEGVNIAFIDNIAGINSVLRDSSTLNRFYLKIYPGYPSLLGGWAWKPLDPKRQHYQVLIDTDEGRLVEDLGIASNNGWKYSATLTNEKTKEVLLQCEDSGYPRAPVLRVAGTPQCTPNFSELPRHFSLIHCIRDWWSSIIS